MKRKITYFGEIEITSPEETNEGQIIIDNHRVESDINFYYGVPEYDWTIEYENYIGHLKQFKADIEAALRSDYKDGGEVKAYVDFHLEELDSSMIDEVLAGTDMSESIGERMLSALRLVRIGFYPGTENYAVWDYTICSEMTDMLVVVNTDSNGKIDHISLES